MTGLAPAFDLRKTNWPVLAATDEPVRRTLNVIAPFTGEVLAKVAVAGERHVQDALFAGFSMFRQKDRRLAVSRRVEILKRALDLLEKNADLLALEAALESGKPRLWCAEEVQQCLNYAREGVLELQLLCRETFPEGAVSGLAESHTTARFDVAEPLGLVVVVLGRHSPLQRAAQSLFAAVVAGCPIIIKPAENIPLSCLRLVHLLHEAGLPYVWCQAVVTESHELTAQLVTDARVALFSFCGSPDVGWKLRSQLAAGTRAVLDHGSLVPVVVAQDADYRAAVEAVADGGLSQKAFSGESIQRVYVLRDSCDTFMAALAERARRIVSGDPLSPDTELGPLPRQSDLPRIKHWVESAVAAGAHLVCGGEAFGRQGYLPTVLFDAPLDAEVSTQAANAPLVVVYPVDSLDEACERANALPLARRAAVFTSSPLSAAYLTRMLDATAVSLNQSIEHLYESYEGEESRRASAGVRRSGLGELGFIADIRAMQIRKTLRVPAWNGFE